MRRSSIREAKALHSRELVFEEGRLVGREGRLFSLRGLLAKSAE